MLGSGLVWYVLYRYVFHELALNIVMVLVFRIGAFRTLRQKPGALLPTDRYVNVNARFMWLRFGLRPGEQAARAAADAAEASRITSDAESRFDGYLANRAAWVHVLGLTWFVPFVMFLVTLSTEDRLGQLGIWNIGWIGGFLFLIFSAWIWQLIMIEKAEQWHYGPPQKDSNGASSS